MFLNNVIIIKTKNLLPQACISDLSWFWLSCWGPLIYLVINNKICSRHDTAESLLKLALNIKQSINQSINHLRNLQNFKIIWLQLGEYERSWWGLFQKRVVHTKYINIYTLLSLSRGRYRVWWTNHPLWYHSPSSQCFRWHGWLNIFLYIIVWNKQFI